MTGRIYLCKNETAEFKPGTKSELTDNYSEKETIVRLVYFDWFAVFLYVKGGIRRNDRSRRFRSVWPTSRFSARRT